MKKGEYLNLGATAVILAGLVTACGEDSRPFNPVSTSLGPHGPAAPSADKPINGPIVGGVKEPTPTLLQTEIDIRNDATRILKFHLSPALKKFEIIPLDNAITQDSKNTFLKYSQYFALKTTGEKQSKFSDPVVVEKVNDGTTIIQLYHANIIKGLPDLSKYVNRLDESGLHAQDQALIDELGKILYVPLGTTWKRVKTADFRSYLEGSGTIGDQKITFIVFLNNMVIRITPSLPQKDASTSTAK